MKISYIVLKGMPLGGGIEKYTEEVGSRLAERGHDITVYTMKHYGAEDGTFRGMQIKSVPSLKTKVLEKLLASFSATSVHTINGSADIVHYHTLPSAFFAFVPRTLGAKVVVQWHGLEWKRSRFGPFVRSIVKAVEYPTILVPNINTSVSMVQKQYIENLSGRKTVCIPTGVNPPKIEQPDLIKKFGLKGDDYILFAARLVREKGIHHLIKAFRQLKTSLKLVIAGDANHEELYKKELRSLAEGDPRIIFTGFVRGKALDELFSNCYLFVLPSEIEGLPTALLEAMSYGNCCLVSDIPENLEAINGIGYTFCTGEVKSLAEKIDMLAGNPDLVNSVKEMAKEHVLKNYSWEDIASKYERLYESLLKPPEDIGI